MGVRPTLEAAFFWASGPCGGTFSLGNRKAHPSQGGRGRGCCLAGSAPGLTPARPSNAQLAKASATSLSRTRGASCLVATASSLYLQQHLSMSSGALPGARAMLACILALIRSRIQPVEGDGGSCPVCALGALHHQEAHGYQMPTEPQDLPPATGTFMTMSQELCLKGGETEA